MFNISDYLKKFARLEGDSLAQKEAISSTLKEICGIEKADYDLKNGILTIKGSPVMKSVIFTRKALLLETINARYPQKRVLDIR